MISTTQWRDLIQKDTRLTRTNVVFDGIDLSDHLMSYEMSDTLDQDGKASVYGMIAVKTISIVLFGQHNKYENVEISHYVEYNGSSETFVYGTFKLNEPVYDEKSDETTFTIWQDNYDDTVLAPIVGATSPQDYMSKQTVIDVDSSEWTLGDTIEVVDSGTAFYETYKEMAMDMALCTSSFGIKRSDQLVYRNFTEVDYSLDYLFEVEIGETMLPVSQLMLLTDLGDNIHDGDDSGTTLQFSNLELIRNNREENIAKLLGEVQGLSYERTTIEYVGDPAIEVGDILDYLDRDGNPRKIYVTGLEFRDNGAFNGVLHAHILTSEESNSNFVGDYTKNLKTTRIEVDKVNQTVDVILGDIDDLHEKDVQLQLDIDGITSTVSTIGNGNILPNGSGEMGYYGYIGGSNLVYTDDLVYQDYMTYSHGFIPKKMLGSLSEWGLSFINSGYDITPSAYVVPNTQYAYKAKVNRFKPFSIQLLEFKNVEDSENLVIHKSTTHTFNNPMQYVSFTQDLDVETQFTRIRYNRTGVTYLDRLEITEVMFNRGVPSEWQQSATNAMIYSQTTRTQLSDRIDDVVDTVEVIDGQVFVNKTNITQLGNEIELKVNVNGVISAINLTSEQAKILANHISLEGLTTINGNFKVLPNGDVEFINAKGTNVNLSGKITTNDLTATGGTIGNMSIQNGVLEYTSPLQDRKYSEADLSIVRQIVLGMISRNNYYNYIYDVNNDGNIDALDINAIKRDLNGLAPITNKKVQYRVRVGTTSGDVNTSVLYNNGQVGANFNMSGETITGNNANFVGMTLNNKLVIPDENGFLKVVEI